MTPNRMSFLLGLRHSGGASVRRCAVSICNQEVSRYPAVLKLSPLAIHDVIPLQVKWCPRLL